MAHDNQGSAGESARAIHVFDRFHVVKLFNEKLSLFRQELQREAQGPLRNA